MLEAREKRTRRMGMMVTPTEWKSIKKWAAHNNMSITGYMISCHNCAVGIQEKSIIPIEAN